MGAGALFIAVFLACVVEAVEATTIVLAAGTARDRRSPGTGMVAALVVLAIITAALGPAVSALPLQALRLFVGALLLVFGLQWLRKAILRASGHKALHDEDAIYREQLSAARSQPATGPPWRPRKEYVAEHFTYAELEENEESRTPRTRRTRRPARLRLGGHALRYR